MNACIGCGTPTTMPPSLCPKCIAERREHMRTKARMRARALTDRLRRATR